MALFGWENVFGCRTGYFLIPIFGQYLLKSNMVAIDRNGGMRTMKKMLDKVKLKLNSGSSIIIFPEGTRVKFGEEILFKRGISVLAEKIEADIFPVAILSGHIWASKAFYKYSSFSFYTGGLNPPGESWAHRPPS